MQEKPKLNEMEEVLSEIKNYYKQWLSASSMTEETFLSHRTCEHFRILLLDKEDGFAVQLCQGKNRKPIGLPFFVGFKNTVSEKIQYFQNTPLILIYLASQLDKANIENPINGSYQGHFFKERVRKVCPQIIEVGQKMVGA